MLPKRASWATFLNGKLTRRIRDGPDLISGQPNPNTVLFQNTYHLLERRQRTRSTHFIPKTAHQITVPSHHRPRTGARTAHTSRAHLALSPTTHLDALSQQTVGVREAAAIELLQNNRERRTRFGTL